MSVHILRNHFLVEPNVLNHTSFTAHDRASILDLIKHGQAKN